nr:Dihydrofolate reductase [uncultured bacterium]
MKAKISLIVAMAENRVIGKENGMPWHIPGELPRFKRITTGHPIIMGRKTYESIGRPLPNRVNIVITRDAGFKVDGVVVVHSLEEALEVAKKAELLTPHPSPLPINGAREQLGEVFIIGGGEIFKQAMPIADKLYLTLIHKNIEGDTHFPKYEKIFSKEVFREDHETEEYRYSFLEFEK